MAWNGCIKFLSTLAKLCGIRQAQFSVVNRNLMEFLVQQWIVMKLNSYLIFHLVWELMDKTCPHIKIYFRKTTHSHEITVVSATSYLPKCSYLSYWYEEFCTALWNMYSCVSRKSYKQLEASLIGFQPKWVHLPCSLWTSSIPWTLLVSWRYILQLYTPSVNLTHWKKQFCV